MEAFDIEDRAWRQWFRVLASAALLTLFAFSMLVYLQLPRIEMVFEDMLGSRARLPLLSQMVLRWGNGQTAGLGLHLLVLLAALTGALTPRPRLAGIAVVAALALFALHLVACVLGLFLPMAQIFQSLGSP